MSATVDGNGDIPHFESEMRNVPISPPGLTSSQWDAICALPAHTDTHIPAEEDQRPAAVYLSDTRFTSELTHLFKKVPVVATTSAYLSEPGTAVALDGYGVPLLVTRDRQGRAHAFINACRHRGSKIVESCEPSKANLMVCPYHAWSYSLEGKLAAIPRHETFPSLKKENLGLVPLATWECGGFIWVGLDHTAQPTLLSGTEQIAADLEAFGLDRMHVYGRRTYDLAANWKLVIEPFLEGYHVQRLHAQSIGNMFADQPSVYAQFGHHMRQTSGKAHFNPELLKADIHNLHKHITHAYLVFPNTVVVTSPYYISVMVLMPRAANRTLVDYYMLVKGKPDTPKAEDLYRRSYELIHAVFGGEDFRAACLQQEALNSGAVSEVHYGGLENMIGPFHRSVESFLPDQP
ncbi:MAG: aromatic ring-hydroxylating dioxygenase subunit alpha [Steroidobacteraceae bacterium]